MSEKKNEGNQEVSEFPARLKSAREMREWTQAELAEKAKMPPSSVAHFESGNRKPSFDTLKTLANVLHVTTDYLIGRADSHSDSQVADTLYRDVAKLSGNDREIAADFVKMLADRNEARKKEK